MSPTTISDGLTPATSPTTRAAVRRRPGTAGYWLGTLVAVLATLGAVVWGTFAFLGWQSHVEQFPRLTADGTMTVSVAAPGTRVVFLEHDRSAAVPSSPDVAVTGPSGVVPVTAHSGERRYDVPGVTGRIADAVLTFPADEPGTYRVLVTGLGPGTSVAVGDDLVSDWAPAVIGSLGLLLGGLLLAVVLVIVTAARRTMAGPGRAVRSR